MICATLKDTKAKLNKLVERAVAGEDVVLMKGSKHIAAIVPICEGDIHLSVRGSDVAATGFRSRIDDELVSGSVQQTTSGGNRGGSRGITDPVVAEFGARARSALGTTLVAIHWFGSRARGESRPDSDYDLLLETGRRLTEEERDRVADIAVDISARRGALLDIHVRTSETMRRDAERSTFIANVLKEAVAA